MARRAQQISQEYPLRRRRRGVRVLLGQLASNGDCLYATTIARQIKADYPGCRLTWAISSLTRSVIAHNPHVDEVWEVPVADWADVEPVWDWFEREALACQRRGIFDRVFLTQIWPNQFRNFDGTVRPSMFRNYPHRIRVPTDPVIRLTKKEAARVDAWFASSPASAAPFVVLFECSSKSGQSSVTPAMACEVAEAVQQRHPGTVFILSTHQRVQTSSKYILFGGDFSLRETARLTHHVNLFVGCGSGVTVVTTSTAARPGLPNVQILNPETSFFGSFKHDLEYFGQPSGHFLETRQHGVEHVADIIAHVAAYGIDSARHRFHEACRADFTHYRKVVEEMLLRRGKCLDAAQSILVTVERYGWHPQLVAFAHEVSGRLFDDARSCLPHRRREIEVFRNMVVAETRYEPAVISSESSRIPRRVS